jgi:hypothetical protein
MISVQITTAPMAAPQAQAQPERTRNVITLDLPPDQVQWLDDQAAGLMSRSAFARILIDRAMKQAAASES